MGTNAPDVAVIGGGIVGLSSALALQRAGLSTLLIDAARGTASASFGNAGHIAVEQAQPLASPAAILSAPGRLFAVGGPLDFRLADGRAWGGWALRYLAASRPARVRAGASALGALLREAMPAWRRLVGGVGRPDLLIESGHLVVWERGAKARAGRAHWMQAPTAGTRVRELSGCERTALVSELRRPMIDGVGFAGTAQVSAPAEVMAAVAAAFRDAGGQRRDARVRSLRRASGRVGIELDEEALWPDQVVVAAGVDCGPLLRTIGYAAPVVAERGYHIEADTDGWKTLPPVVFEDRAMIVTRFGDRLRAASFVEFAAPDAPPDARKWARLDRHAAELGLAMRGTVSRWVGSRPTLPDYLPAIGRSRRAANLIYAFGHQHLGLTLAPITGEMVADVALDRTPIAPLAPYDLARFDSGPSPNSSPSPSAEAGR